VGCRKSKAAWKAAAAEYTPGLRQQAQQRTSILDRDGEEVTEPEQVVEVFRQHYETLGQP
jgi:hypothetical protein